VSGLYRLTVSQGGTFFLANQGALGNGKGFNNQGFAICQSCGRDLSDEVRKAGKQITKGSRQNRARVLNHYDLLIITQSSAGSVWVFMI
jgi:hypothetical protein